MFQHGIATMLRHDQQHSPWFVPTVRNHRGLQNTDPGKRMQKRSQFWFTIWRPTPMSRERLIKGCRKLTHAALFGNVAKRHDVVPATTRRFEHTFPTSD